MKTYEYFYEAQLGSSNRISKIGRTYTHDDKSISTQALHYSPNKKHAAWFPSIKGSTGAITYDGFKSFEALMENLMRVFPDGAKFQVLPVTNLL